MELGAVASKIDVTSELALIETETTRISDTHTDEALKSFRSNDRSMYSFLQQIPGMLVMTGGNAISASPAAAATRRTRPLTASASTTSTTAA